MATLSSPSIQPCPQPGAGVHSWCWHAYQTMRDRGYSHAESAQYCRDNATRKLASGDIPNERGTGGGKRSFVFVPKPVYVPSKLEQVARRMDGFGVDEFFRKSPLRPDVRTPASFLRELYHPSEKVIVFDTFVSQGQAVWQCPGNHPYNAGELDTFVRPIPGNGAWFLCNPVTGDTIEVERCISDNNPRGKSRRVEECLTAFRFLVLESDQAPGNLWLSALAQIPLLIVAVYSSGGKSIHALVRVDAENGKHWREIKAKIAPHLVTLGADDCAMTAVRLTRLPQCFRAETQRWQELFYLNPKADGTPICEQMDRKKGGDQ